jgi:hypothetical protein
MAISVDWLTRVITVPQADLTLSAGITYIFDVNAFRLELKAIEDDPDGIPQPDTHQHNTEVTLSGVTYARFFEIINGYTVLFEETGSPYVVIAEGANHNIADVKVAGNGSVSLITNNSAGLITVTTGALTTAQDTLLSQIGASLLNRVVTDPVAGTYTIYADDDATVLLSGNLWEDASGTQAYQGQGAERRDRLT